MTDLNELVVERHIAAPPERVWEAMTTRMPEWFCPRPWRAEMVEQDWRAGGRSAMTFHGPDGETMPQEGVFLEVVPGRRFVFTDAYRVGWVPQKPFITGFFDIAPDGDGTRYRASARHWDEEARKQHEAMGFTQGWGAAAAQLAELCEGWGEGKPA